VMTPGLFRNRMRRRLARGVQGSARVLSRRAPFAHATFVPIEWLELMVDLPGAASYVALHRDQVPVPMRESLVGRELVVRVDPNDRRVLLILWTPGERAWGRSASANPAEDQQQQHQ